MANNSDNTIMVNGNTTQREYKDERFEFALYVNDKLIAKRNFKINNYINGSMQTINFKETVDGIVRSIDDDLKSKSRVYTWYYFNEDDILDEFKTPLLKEWECTFKFEVTDNHVPVITKIWDGYAYPKAIREKVDIANKFVKIVARDGKTYTYDKETYFKENEGKLNAEMYVLKAMINDKQDLLSQITRKICETCSPREESYQAIGDYTVSEVYKSRNFDLNEDGTVKTDKNGNPLFVKTADSKKYFYSINLINNNYISSWAQAVQEKTKNYMSTLYF